MHSVASYRPFGAFRLLLATFVLAQHYLANGVPEAIGAATARFELGSIAVLVFFCLSGFVICEAADAIYPGRPGAFIANRLLRIAPHFVAAVLATIVLTAWVSRAGPVRVSRTDILDPSLAFGARNLLVNGLGFLPFTNLAMRVDLLPVAWAVRVEMIFYLVVAALLWTARRAGPSGLDRLGFPGLAAWAAAGMAPLFVLSILHRAPAFLQLAPYFTLGGALYFLQTRRGTAAPGIAASSLAFIAWEFAARPVHHPALGFERAVGAQALLLGTCLAAVAVLARCRSGRLAPLDRRLGDLSYPLYIWHDVVLLAGLALGVESSLAYGAALAVVAVCVAVLAHRCIDPGVDRLRDMIRGRRLRSVRSRTSEAEFAST